MENIEQYDMRSNNPFFPERIHLILTSPSPGTRERGRTRINLKIFSQGGNHG